MRSLLVQASSVEKAVEKAWSSAGMPTEFTIKILEFGEKSFFGFEKRIRSSSGPLDTWSSKVIVFPGISTHPHIR